MALNTLRNVNGRVIIKDWHKEVRETTNEELAALSNQPFNEQEFKEEYHIEKLVNNMKDIEVNKALATMPTCNIAGLISGHTSEGIRNIVPARAVAKLDFRLVPDVMPEKQFERLTDHFKENGFNDIYVKFLDGEPPARTPIKHPFVKIIEEAAREIFGTSIISISSAGAGPMYYFHKVLNTPCVSIGSTYIHAKTHSPNEFARIDLLNKTTKCIGSILEKIGNL
jgi:acetylornithine deacetylase/succinyl-diaminopimelate desuccinylase-like protein